MSALFVVTTTVTQMDDEGVHELLSVVTHCDPGAIVQAITQNGFDIIEQIHRVEDDLTPGHHDD